MEKCGKTLFDVWWISIEILWKCALCYVPYWSFLSIFYHRYISIYWFSIFLVNKLLVETRVSFIDFFFFNVVVFNLMFINRNTCMVLKSCWLRFTLQTEPIFLLCFFFLGFFHVWIMVLKQEKWNNKIKWNQIFLKLQVLFD